MPGQPVRTCASFRIPLAIHPRELPAATGVTANHRSASVENPTFSLTSLCGNTLLPATRKQFAACAEAVEDETSLWKLRKNKEKLGQAKCLPRMDNLYAVKESLKSCNTLGHLQVSDSKKVGSGDPVIQQN